MLCNLLVTFATLISEIKWDPDKFWRSDKFIFLFLISLKSFIDHIFQLKYKIIIP